MKLLKNKADIQKLAKSINTRGKKLDNDIWIAAVSAMAHHAEHGDVTIINEVVDALPKGSRVNALRDFITAHGKVGFDGDNQIFTHDKAGSFDLDGALAKSWVEFKPEQPYQPIDAAKLIAALVKKVQGADASKGDKCTEKQAKAVLALATELGIEVK
tara:strand:- start:3032 stop:3505 length:474 start_codon:yes stop_codon:yes gene_type:complete